MIIGISGKKQSGKDTVAHIIRYLTAEGDGMDIFWKNKGGIQEYLKVASEYKPDNSDVVWKIKRFADELKMFVSRITGIPLDDLEKEEVKQSYLGEEWDRFMFDGQYYDIDTWSALHQSEYNKAPTKDEIRYFRSRVTVRTLLQEVGTDAMRNIIHPNIWVNATFAKYRTNFEAKTTEEWGKNLEPKWIIPDMRFPNELKAVEERKGITIRVDRPLSISSFREGVRYRFKEGFLDGTIKTVAEYGNANWCNSTYTETDRPYIERALTGKNAENGLCGIQLIEHESETALDFARFDYSIINDGTLEQLVDKVRYILEQEKII